MKTSTIYRVIAGTWMLLGIGCSASVDTESAEPGKALIASLKASPETVRDQHVVRWDIVDSEHGRLARGVDDSDHTLFDLAIEHARDADDWSIRVVTTNARAVLHADGTLGHAESDQIAGVALALFRDAQTPATLAPPAGDQGTVGERASAVVNGYADSGWVKYNAGGDCLAQTIVFYSNTGVDSRTTVRSPYLFSGCWVRTNLTLFLEAGYAEAHSYTSMACSVWDPNCPEERMTQSVFNASANVGNVIIGYYSPGNGTTRF